MGQGMVEGFWLRTPLIAFLGNPPKAVQNSPGAPLHIGCQSEACYNVSLLPSCGSYPDPETLNPKPQILNPKP